MPQKTNEKIEKEIIKLYNEGYGTIELSKKFNLHRATIQRILKSNNIKLRKRAPVHYNIHFFDEYNEASCYWAGFIAADGYVRSDRNAVTIHLASVDSEHLLKLANLTNYEGNVNINKNECYISFSGEWFQKALADNFDIHPRKTFNVKISEKIPEDMVKHFIRGYFDGDGSITSSCGYLRINIASGSKTLLEQIADYIFKCNIKTRNATGKPSISYSHIDYSCTNAYKILKILYDDSTELNRLDRKYNLYLKYKSIYNEINGGDN